MEGFMKIKIGELKNTAEGLNNIMGEKLPIKAAYAFTKLVKAIQNEFKLYEENRMKLIENFSNKGEDGKPIVINGQYDIGDKQSFAKEYTELSNIEVEIDFTIISVNDLGNVNISPAAMLSLEKFVGD